MNNLFRKFKGYLNVTALSDSPERFFNLCRARNIQLWNIVKNSDGCIFCISLPDFRRLKDILKKTKMKVKIRSRFGLPFLMFKYRKHYSFLIGIMLSAAMIYGMSLFVWDISFEGNYSYTDNVLMSYLKDMDISPGIMVESLSCDNIETEIRKSFNDISWVSAEISGTKLIVHIKENDLSIGKETMTENDTSDITADMDGIVSSIITRRGIPKVAVGSQVTAGMILVSGEVPVYNDAKEVIKYNYVHSDSDVFINTQYEYYEELPVLHDYKLYTGEILKKKTFNIWGKQLEIGFGFKKFKNYDIVTEEKVIKLTSNFCLPVRTGQKMYYEYDITQGEYSQEEAESILYENYNVFLRRLQENGIQTIDSNVKMVLAGDKYIMKGTVYVNQKQDTHSPVTVTEQQVKDEKANEHN